MTADHSKLLIQSFLSSNYICLNKDMIRCFGINKAIILCDLISKEKYFFDKNELTEDDWFFNSRDNLENDTGLTDFQQRKALNDLKELGIIDFKLKGIPPRKYFKLFFKKLENQFLRNLKINTKETSKLINKNNINKNNIKKLSKDNNDGFLENPGITDSSNSPKKNKFIEKWNAYNHTPTHSNRTSKTYLKTSKIFLELQKGTFFKERAWDSKYQDKEFSKLKDHRFTTKEIMEGLLHLSNYFLNGYWPQDKKSLKNKPLTYLLYNSVSHKSRFIDAFISKSKSFKQSLPKDHNSLLTELFIEELNLSPDPNNHPQSMKDLIQVSKDIKIYHNWLMEMDDGRPGSQPLADYEELRHPYRFTEVYISWLHEYWSERDINPIYIGPKSTAWYKFLGHLKGEYWDRDTVFNLNMG